MTDAGSLRPINGLILGGGASQRMGKDKSLMAFHGKPQREYLFELLSQFSQEVFLSCKEDDKVPETLNPLPDRFLMQSPMNGVLSAFQLDATTSWLTVPVDMPGIQHDIIAHLIKHSDPLRQATCFVDSEGTNPEPLFVLWEPSAFRPLMKYYNSGGISPRNFLKQADVLLLHPPDTSLHVNINTPDEWVRYKRDQSLL